MVGQKLNYLKNRVCIKSEIILKNAKSVSVIGESAWDYFLLIINP